MSFKAWIAALGIAFSALMVTGCATMPEGQQTAEAETEDEERRRPRGGMY